MGNYKFRLADMMPNAWFYKLRDNMKKKPRNQNSNPQTLNSQKSTKKKKKSSTFHNWSPSPSPSSSPSTTTTTTTTLSFNHKPKHSPRKSYYFTRDLIPRDHSPKYSPPKLSDDSPRRSSSSSKRSPRRRCGPHIKHAAADCDHSRHDGALSTDVVIDVDKASLSVGVDHSLTKVELPPIITKPPPKPPKKKDNNASRSSSQGIRLRVNHSPRIVNRKVSGLKKNAGATSAAASSRSGLSESLAVVKSSSDPQRDFRESMMEMIVENNIRASKDLEDLLACYLSLNSDEYHAIIIKAFKQIWFDLTHTRNINRIN